MAEDKVSEPKNNANIADTISELVLQCLKHWKLFVASFVVIVGLQVFSLLRKESLYQSKASLMIKEETSGGLGNMAATLGELGGFAASLNVDNEVEALKSPAVTSKVIDLLKLNIDYKQIKSIKKITLYGSNRPFEISFPDALDSKAYSVEGVLENEDTFVIYKITSEHNKRKTTYEDLDYRLNIYQRDSVETEIGTLKINPNERFTNGLYAEEDIRVEIKWTPKKSIIEKVNEKVRVELANRRSSVINLSIIDESIERADDILNTVINVYNQYWVEDKNQIINTTSKFINQRLDVISNELFEVDRNISAYKSKNALPDLAAIVSVDLAKQSEAEKKIIELQSQYTMAKNLQEFVNNPENYDKVLPSLTITGLSSGSSGNAEITEYNTTLMERNRLASANSVSNPLVVDYDRRLDGMRKAIAQTVSTQVDQLKTALNDMIAERNRASGRIANSPNQANDLLGVERQQKVKEALYLYLLEKKEENDLSQAFTAYNTRVITPPMTAIKPVGPKVLSSIVIAIFFAGLLPLIYIYVKVSLDTFVRSRADLDARVKIPFLGNIPFYGKTPSKIKQLFKKKNQEDQPSEIIVKRGNGSAVNEAFRMVRSNLELMNSRLLANREEKSVVTMITSAIPGSGKTFVSLNLAAAYALKNNKVVVVDVDLRKATLSKSFGSPHKGVTSYLSGTSTLNEITIKNASGMDNLDVVPAGAIPPDPAELIDSPQFKKMIEELRAKYDVVLLDCPPTEPVTDSLVITRLVDRTVYVVRVGRLKRTFLYTLQDYYERKRFTNMTTILNAVDGMRSKSYGYGYGNIEKD